MLWVESKSKFKVEHEYILPDANYQQLMTQYCVYLVIHYSNR